MLYDLPIKQFRLVRRDGNDCQGIKKLYVDTTTHNLWWNVLVTRRKRAGIRERTKIVELAVTYSIRARGQETGEKIR